MIIFSSNQPERQARSLTEVCYFDTMQFVDHFGRHHSASDSPGTHKANTPVTNCQLLTDLSSRSQKLEPIYALIKSPNPGTN